MTLFSVSHLPALLPNSHFSSLFQAQSSPFFFCLPTSHLPNTFSQSLLPHLLTFSITGWRDGSTFKSTHCYADPGQLPAPTTVCNFSSRKIRYLWHLHSHATFIHRYIHINKNKYLKNLFYNQYLFQPLCQKQ